MYGQLPEEPPQRSISKGSLSLYLVVSLLTIGTTCVCLALQDWFTYCFWDWGLAQVSANQDLVSFTSGVKTFDKGDTWTYNEFKSDFCSGVTKSAFEMACPKMCSYRSDVMEANFYMLAFGAFTLLVLAVNALLHFIALCKNGTKCSTMPVLLVLPTLSFLAGFVVYIVLGGMTDFKGTKGSIGGMDTGAEDSELGPGIILGIVLIVVNSVLTVIGLVYTKHAFF